MKLTLWLTWKMLGKLPNFGAVTIAGNLRPLTSDDIPELSEFLITGFGAELGAYFASPDVLRWKYLEKNDLASGAIIAGNDQALPSGQSSQSVQANSHQSIQSYPDYSRSYVARNESGRIIGHLGLCRTYFEGRGIMTSSGQVVTMHIIDWLGSPEQRSIGMSLLRLVHQGGGTQFALGATPLAVSIGERSGYEPREVIPVYSYVLRARYWLRTTGSGSLHRWLRVGRELLTRLVRPSISRQTYLTLERVLSFGPELTELITKIKAHVILTGRDPARLNRFLQFPCQAFSGWYLHDQAGCLRGFALLNLVSHDGGQTRTGKIVDCLLDNIESSFWQSAILALTQELKRQGADVVQCYASTPWMIEALSKCSFVSRFGVKFLLRDPRGQIPRGATFHLTALEGDYAYT
jgi:hypothetical protein